MCSDTKVIGKNLINQTFFHFLFRIQERGFSITKGESKVKKDSSTPGEPDCSI